MLQSCSTAAPAINKVTGECWYYRKDSNCDGDPLTTATDLSSAASCSDLAPDSSRAVCEVVAAGDDTQRLCACMDSGDRRLRERRSAAAMNESSDSALQQQTDSPDWAAAPAPAASSASAAAAPRSYLLQGLMATAVFRAAGAHSSFSGPSTGTTAAAAAAAFAAVVLLQAEPAAAHNWYHTPARSAGKASTARPCIPRKSTDTHQQVGPGQHFMISWATGHAGDGSRRCLHPIEDVQDPKCIPVGKEYTSISIIHEDDYHWLKHEDYTTFFEEYVVEAPAEQRYSHMDPHWSRLHGLPDKNCGNCDGLGEERGGQAGFELFASMSKPIEPPHGSHFHVPGGTAFALPLPTDKGECNVHPDFDEKLGILACSGDGGTLYIPTFVDPEADGSSESKYIPASEKRYLRKLLNTSADWLDHEMKPTSHLYRYIHVGDGGVECMWC